MSIRRFMDISTSHVSQGAAAWLDETGKANAKRVDTGIPFVAITFSGWLLHASSFESHDKLHPDLIAAVEHARANDCAYILFDADAEVDSFLRTYEEI